jgi:signal transduction histidine kinase
LLATPLNAVKLVDHDERGMPMSLALGLILRVLGVALVCVSLAVAWVVVDTNRALQSETVATADRVARQLLRRPWLGSAQEAAYDDPLSTRQALGVITVMGPGICLDISSSGGSPQHLCNGSDTLGIAMPNWFRAASARFINPGQPVPRTITSWRGTRSELLVWADPVAATARAWRQIRLAVGLALAMGAGMAALTAASIAHALRPSHAIVRGIRQLEAGNYASRLPAFTVSEFLHIAEALNAMADRLERTLADRKALTLRLLQVQEHERRALARDLHDEFGQCLTAIGALAASLQADCQSPNQKDVFADARRIGQITGQMMATLKGAFARLRPPELDQLGLEACLRTMLRGWATLAGRGTDYRLEVDGDLSAVPPDTALSVYRIAQECLTNAARHGSPSRIMVRVARGSGEDTGEGITLLVEDDGGGTPERIDTSAGFGVLGIRERLSALGGSLSFGRSEGGVRMTAFVPITAPAAA